MTPLFSAQRAAEEFDQALRGRPTAAVDERYDQLLATVELLRTQPELQPRAEFVSDLRSRLMTAAETELVRAPAGVHQLAPRRAATTRRQLSTVAASLLIVGGTAGVATASSDALPGDSLYPVKRGVEQVQAAAHLDPATRGAVQLDQAATRLEEVRALQARSADPALVEETMTAFQEAAESGSEKLFGAYRTDGDAAHIEDVRQFTTAHIRDISELGVVAGPQSTDAFIDAADTVADIDAQARGLCRSCEQTPLRLPEALAAGSGALGADVLLTRPATQAAADVALAQAQLDDSIAKLQAAAEKKAATVPTPAQFAAAAEAATNEQTTRPGTPVTSTITPDGQLLPTVVGGVGTAVTNLVSGVTGTLETIVDQLPKTGTPLDDTVRDLTKGLGRATDEIGRELGRGLGGQEPGSR